MGHLLAGYWTSVFIALVLHEAAHLVAAFVLKVKVKRLGLSWRGPYIVREAGTPVKNTIVSLAGPGINLVICLLSYRVALMLSLVNGILGLFNLLPFIPSSDGQRVYRLWTHRATASAKTLASHSSTPAVPPTILGAAESLKNLLLTVGLVFAAKHWYHL